MMNMQRRISVIPVAVIVAVLAIAFLWCYSAQERRLSEADTQYQMACVTSNDLEVEQNKLKATLDTVNTDAFIEKQARTLYDYMNPDEIRIVITNPEVLYGTAVK